MYGNNVVRQRKRRQCDFANIRNSAGVLR